MPPSRLRWLGILILTGVFYALVGIVFGSLAGKSATLGQTRAWRLAAWVVSAAAFGAHIAFERVGLRSSAVTTAMRAASAAALGALGLAVAALLHSRGAPRHFPGLMLLVWPAITGLPAFVVALIAAAVLPRRPEASKLTDGRSTI